MPVPSLRELQSLVMRALLDGDSDAAAPFISAGGIAPQHLFGIYANNARSNFITSLNSSFPAVRRLVGEDYFLQAARGFHARHPSTSGDLQPAGAGFAQHLSDLHADDQYRYLGEMARFEWLLQETLLAAGHELTARLFASEFPCWAIWEANVLSDAEPDLIDLGCGPDRVLLFRDRGQLQFHRLSCAEYTILQSLQAGELIVNWSVGRRN